MPVRVTLEVAFSDAMDSYVSGQYSGYSSKSVSAYQTFLNLRNLRIPLTLTTHLDDSYSNMVIEELISDEDVRTQFAWRGRIVFREILMAQVQTTNLPSGRPNQTITSNPGTPGVTSVPQNLTQYQNSAGEWSSNASNALP
jgi:hypothetical protein